MTPTSVRIFLGLLSPAWLAIAFLNKWEGEDPMPAAIVALVHFVGYLVVVAVMGVADDIKAADSAPSEAHGAAVHRFTLTCTEENRGTNHGPSSASDAASNAPSDPDDGPGEHALHNCGTCGDLDGKTCDHCNEPWPCPAVTAPSPDPCDACGEPSSTEVAVQKVAAPVPVCQSCLDAALTAPSEVTDGRL